VRAALLPTPGNPHMLRYWLANFETWREHVDELLVYINGGDPADHEESFDLATDAGAKVVATDWSAGHAGALLALVQGTEADNVVLCEDDAYVRWPASVREAFDDAENGLAVGSPRHEDYHGHTVAFPPYTPGDFSEMRRGLWPTFLFIKRQHLFDTDRNFSDMRWTIGSHIEGWGDVTRELCEYVGVAAEYVHLDTFFGTTFQLRAKGLRTRLVHHVRLFDAAAADNWEPGPWFHVTGLSTLQDALSFDGSTFLPDLDEHGGLWTRRVAWWRRVGIDMSEFIRLVGIREDDLAAWDRRFDRWAPVMREGVLLP